MQGGEMLNISNAENVLKNVYLGVLSNQLGLGSSNKILKCIQQTTSDVFGAEIIIYEDYKWQEKIQKSLKTFCFDIKMSDKAVRCALQSVGVFVNLLNSECESLVLSGTQNILNALCEEIRADCGINSSDKTIKEYLSQHLDLVESGIKMHQLCDWLWLENEEHKALRLDDRVWKATLVKYANFIFTKDFIKQIKADL
jgi:hypothetical protein